MVFLQITFCVAPEEFISLSLHIRKLVSLPSEMFTANSVHEDPVLGFFVYLAGGRLTGSVHFHTQNTFFQPNLKILFNKATVIML